MRMCTFGLRSLFPPYRGGRMRTLNSARKTDRSGFRYWMYFLFSNLMEEISLQLRVLSDQLSIKYG